MQFFIHKYAMQHKVAIGDQNDFSYNHRAIHPFMRGLDPFPMIASDFRKEHSRGRIGSSHKYIFLKSPTATTTTTKQQ